MSKKVRKKKKINKTIEEWLDNQIDLANSEIDDLEWRLELLYGASMRYNKTGTLPREIRKQLRKEGVE